MPVLRRWIAYDVLLNSEQDPEPTRWDDAETLKQKLQASADRKRGMGR
jgi:hypothetical protein